MSTNIAHLTILYLVVRWY